MKIRLENQNTKEGMIGRLREMIAEISKKLQASNKPALRDKNGLWGNSLNRLSQRLDEVAKMPSDQLQAISQACDEISRELKKIEGQVTSPTGFLPSQTRGTPTPNPIIKQAATQPGVPVTVPDSVKRPLNAEEMQKELQRLPPEVRQRIMGMRQLPTPSPQPMKKQ